MIKLNLNDVRNVAAGCKCICDRMMTDWEESIKDKHKYDRVNGELLIYGMFMTISVSERKDYYECFNFCKSLGIQGIQVRSCN